MRSRQLPISMLVALCLATPWHAGAQVYKWLDERGVVNYGDTPPQQARGVKPLDLQSGIDTVIPGIPQEELDRLREQDRERRLRQLEAEVEDLRAREAARSTVTAAPSNEPVYRGHPVFWVGRTLPTRGGHGRDRRPVHPIAKPWPSDPAMLPGGRPSVGPKGNAVPPNRRPPGPGQLTETTWRR